MTRARIPAALLETVRRDLRPVRPLATPIRRALRLLPLGMAVSAGIPLFWSWRAHLTAWAPWPAGLLSALELGLGLTIVAASFRESIPGRELSTRTIAGLVAIAAIVFALLNPTLPAPAAVPAHTAMRWMGECIVRTITFSIPALMLTGWLVARGLPNRPALTGALSGLGVGLMGDAGLRLLCWDGDSAHVIVAHGGSMVLVVVLGALSAMSVERFKSRRRAAVT